MRGVLAWLSLVVLACVCGLAPNAMAENIGGTAATTETHVVESGRKDDSASANEVTTSEHSASDRNDVSAPFSQNSPGAVNKAAAARASQPHIQENFVVGRVKAVTAPNVNEQLLRSTGIVARRELAEVEILEGPMQGSTVYIPNEITDNPAYNIQAVPGKELILSVVSEGQGQNPEINIADYHRVPVLAALFAAFLAVFLFFGGKEGFKSLIGLVVGILLIGMVLLPMSFKGINPLMTAALICVAVTITTTTLVGGFSRKALAATLGTIGGVIVSGVAAQLVITSAPLTGLSTEEAQILRGSVLSQPAQFYSGLLAAGMLIGALGVIMDVAVSIASAVYEVSQTDRSLSRAQLYKKGMNVGRDIMGTMTNTLILAYAGSALPLLLLMSQIPSSKLLNLDLVATEIASALTGSLGLICTIPLTALAAAHLMSAMNRGTSSRRPMTSQEDEFEQMLWSNNTAAGGSRSNRD
jgi:uncharacterized membrane protein